MTRAKAKTPPVVEKPNNDPMDVKQFTLREAAEQIGIHRVTLKRYEDQGVVERASWARHPQPHRVYSLRDIEKMRVVINARQAKDNRVYIDEPVQAGAAE